ncbi:RES domain-containing protein [Paraburkholderia sp. DHOC27]|nr:RES domain-containing protein [Paraburkholderia sp. DHOC27]
MVPDRVTRAYRFGPPGALIAPDGAMPFWWLYLAFDPDTTVWEARFCQNDLTRPGTFYIDQGAERDGLIATLRFPRPLRLWNLNSDASSKLGIADMLSSPDHEWCQWFGVRLHDAIGLCANASRPDGIVYPSRRHRGRAAIILSSAALESMRAEVRQEHMRFVDHDAYGRLAGDPLLVLPPLASDVPPR